MNQGSLGNSTKGFRKGERLEAANTRTPKVFENLQQTNAVQYTTNDQAHEHSTHAMVKSYFQVHFENTARSRRVERLSRVQSGWYSHFGGLEENGWEGAVIGRNAGGQAEESGTLGRAFKALSKRGECRTGSERKGI